MSVKQKEDFLPLQWFQKQQKGRSFDAEEINQITALARRNTKEFVEVVQSHSPQERLQFHANLMRANLHFILPSLEDRLVEVQIEHSRWLVPEALLTQASESFKIFFSPSTREGKTGVLSLDLPSALATPFFAIPQGNDYPFSSLTECVELFFIADKYLVPKVEESCLQYIYTHLTPQTVAEAYLATRLYPSSQLYRDCLDIAKEDFSSIQRSSSFQKLPSHIQLELRLLNNGQRQFIRQMLIILKEAQAEEAVDAIEKLHFQIASSTEVLQAVAPVNFSQLPEDFHFFLLIPLFCEEVCKDREGKSINFSLFFAQAFSCMSVEKKKALIADLKSYYEANCYQPYPSGKQLLPNQALHAMLCLEEIGPQIARFLHDSDPQLLREIIPLFVDRLSSLQSSILSPRIIHALHTIDPPSIVMACEVLQKTLSSDDPRQQAAAAIRLQIIAQSIYPDPLPDSTLEALQAHLSDTDPRVSFQSLLALSYSPPPINRTILPQCLTLLTSDSPLKTERGFYYEGCDRLEYSSQRSHSAASFLLERLVEIGSESEIMDTLMICLHDSSSAVRSAAARALGKVGSSQKAQISKELEKWLQPANKRPLCEISAALEALSDLNVFLPKELALSVIHQFCTRGNAFRELPSKFQTAVDASMLKALASHIQRDEMNRIDAYVEASLVTYAHLESKGLFSEAKEVLRAPCTSEVILKILSPWADPEVLFNCLVKLKGDLHWEILGELFQQLGRLEEVGVTLLASIENTMKQNSEFQVTADTSAPHSAALSHLYQVALSAFTQPDNSKKEAVRKSLNTLCHDSKIGPICQIVIATAMWKVKNLAILKP